MTVKTFREALEKAGIGHSARVCRLSGESNYCLVLDVNDPSQRQKVVDDAKFLGLDAKFVAGAEWYGHRSGVRVAIYGLEE